MTHPIVPQILELAQPLAEQLNLELVNVVFQTNKNPPVLRVDVCNRGDDTSLEDCEQMSRSLEAKLDTTEIMPGTYVLEISSPGIPRTLTTEREFISFKGFPIVIETHTPYKQHQQWEGKLQSRDEKSIYINQKGKTIAIPRNLVINVQLQDGE
jgi:ribosome maturation factor RimP